VNRDDLRFMLYEEYWGGKIDEDTVTMAQYAIVDAALAAGRDVYIDDMNLSEIALHNLVAAAGRHPGTNIIWHDHTDVPLQTCIERDEARDRHVTAPVITDLWERYIK
jgi:predicted kinase